MKDQLDIPFPKYCFDIDKAKVNMLQAELQKCYEIIEKQKRTITTYKGHFTKQKSKSNPKITYTMAKPLELLDQFLQDHLYSFKTKHGGRQPDYILMTVENFELLQRELQYLTRGLWVYTYEHDGQNYVVNYRGIQILPVQEGLKKDAIKLVIE